MSLSQWILTWMCEVCDIDVITPVYRGGGLNPREGANVLWVTWLIYTQISLEPGILEPAFLRIPCLPGPG